MPMREDGDHVRAIGYVALYHADLEDVVDGVLERPAVAEAIPEGKRKRLDRMAFGDKLDLLEHRARPLIPTGPQGNQARADFDNAIKECRWCACQRNRILHSPVLEFPSWDFRMQISERHGSREITASDIYAVARRIWETVGLVHGVGVYLHRLKPAEA